MTKVNKQLQAFMMELEGVLTALEFGRVQSSAHKEVQLPNETGVRHTEN